MKKKLSRFDRLVVVILFVASIAFLYFVAHDFYKEEKIKEQVRMVLKDPDSAKFKLFFISKYGAGCGFVNSKNSMGGYTGFKEFVVGPDGEVKFENSDGDNIKFLSAADVYCTDYFFEHTEYNDLIQKGINQSLHIYPKSE
jgi:hypothetical protein